ncbi:MAG: hypothetical protein F6K28_47530 [Microcoleus sp. SIO2G3]|nr:hypothetical protein [Microcoleus sp. SIO2G3]
MRSSSKKLESQPETDSRSIQTGSPIDARHKLTSVAVDRRLLKQSSLHRHGF